MTREEQVRYYRSLANQAYMEAQDLMFKSEQYDEIAWRLEREEVMSHAVESR
jgi:hypothetical protein